MNEEPGSKHKLIDLINSLKIRVYELECIIPEFHSSVHIDIDTVIMLWIYSRVYCDFYRKKIGWEID